VASLFLDHNLSPWLAALLREAGHAVTTARALGLDRASDAEILQHMARSGLIVVTADTDFVHLHELGQVEHAGVLLVPQRSRADTGLIVAALGEIFSSGRPLTNELYAWNAEVGWVRRA